MTLKGLSLCTLFHNLHHSLDIYCIFVWCDKQMIQVIIIIILLQQEATLSIG